MLTQATVRDFSVVLIKPSRYDIDGYPIVWYKALIPSNSLAVLNGIVEDCANRDVLGPDVKLHIELVDETSRRVDTRSLLKKIKQRGGGALVCMVGVQSNQFPRAVDLARPFLSAGVPVVIGGFHVSGCISMLPELPTELSEALAMGISLFAGEAEEGRFDEVLRDADKKALKPIYNHLKDLPGMTGAPSPLLPASILSSNLSKLSSFDLGRGCPFQCSFCTIINVQGRKSRFRSPDDLERIVRENWAQGIHMFFITDDNFARNALWEQFLDRLIALREQENIRLHLIIQVDTQCHKIKNFIDKCVRAGVRRVFIGLENINPDNLLAAKKRQNKITDYRLMMQEWHKRRVFMWAGYIIGFPHDTKATVLRDIEIIKRELPVDQLEFFFLTPLPGSEDHREMRKRGEWMDADLNKYNLHHRVTHHPNMSDREWEETYDLAWRNYYSWEHIERVARRRAANDKRDAIKVVRYMSEFKAIYEIERVHVLEGGIIRLKYRADRRPGYTRLPPGIFHAQLLAENIIKAVKYAGISLKAFFLCRSFAKGPVIQPFADISTTPLSSAEEDDLMIFTDTSGGSAAVSKQRSYEDMRMSVMPLQPRTQQH